MPIIAGNVPDNPLSQVTPLEAPRQVQPRLDVRANPEDFGAQVGQATEKVGGEVAQQAQQWNGLIAETQANQSELDYIKAQGDLKAKYTQYEGLQADAMRPKYEQESLALQQQYRQNLSPIAGKLFDANTRRTLANDISEYSGYAAGQVKSANLNTQKALQVNAATSMGNLPSALDDTQVGSAVGKATAAQHAISDLNGDASIATGTDSKTGKLTFPDTPEGQAASARYNEQLSSAVAPIYMTAAKTIADNQGAAAAATWAQKHWDMMPDKAKVEMNQYLAPKMVNEDIDGAIATANTTLAGNRQKQIVSNVPNSPTQPTAATSDLLDVIHKNEGFTGKIGRDSNGANVVNGVNEKSFPQDFATISAAYQKSKADGDAATNDFFQQNIIDTYNIKSLPPATQAIVADGLVNHGINDKPGNFGASLLKAAQDGATPQTLIDMRRQEYQRLADSDTDGSKGYASSLKGWNNRLNNLEPQQQYTNDFERLTASRQTFIDSAVNAITEKRGSDLGLIATTQRRAEANIDAQIRVAKGALDADQKNIQDAINGGLTKGQVPMTVEQLRATPGMAPMLDKVEREQPEFYNTILTRIAKAQHYDATQNSPNAYDSIQAVLDTSKPYPRQERIEYLSKGLGSENPGFSISQKDFNDAKPAVDLDDGRGYLAETMKSIAQANGNVDGKGQERAVQWYNQTMNAWKANQAKEGDKKISEADFFNAANKDLPAPQMPSRMQQLQNHVATQAQRTPTIGAVSKGYSYKGGEPSLPTSWEKVP